MKIPVRRFDTAIPLPAYQTPGAAAVDLAVRNSAIIPPHQSVMFYLNVALKLPPGHFALMAARSSLQKRGLVLRNGVGILDEDYAGNEDEYRAVLYNFTDEPVEVQRGERLVQAIFMPYVRVEWDEVSKLDGPNRDGYGTTGK